MINAYFNQSGYYLADRETTIFNTVSRSSEVSEEEHLYLVLIRLLQELQVLKLNYTTVTLHNDSVIVDHMNGAPLNDAKLLPIRATINRHLIPSVNAHLLFKKMPSDKINEILTNQRQKLIVQVDFADAANNTFKKHHATRVAKLRESNDSNQPKQ